MMAVIRLRHDGFSTMVSMVSMVSISGWGSGCGAGSVCWMGLVLRSA